QYFNRTNVLTNILEDSTINVTFRGLTRKNVPHPGGHAFQQTGTIFALIQDITNNVLNKFNKDWTINVLTMNNAPAP
ncbi:hypothetical protein DPMN_070514, partial [Dreissena polymorpha]